MAHDLDELSRKLEEARHGKKPTPEEAEKQEQSENLKAGMHAGFEFVASIGLCTFLGYWIDQYFETKPAFLLGLFFLGVVVGFYNIYRITNNYGTKVGFSELHSEEKKAKTQSEKDINNSE